MSRWEEGGLLVSDPLSHRCASFGEGGGVGESESSRTDGRMHTQHRRTDDDLALSLATW